MSGATTILVALLLPLAGAVAILLASRVGPNLREVATLITAIVLALVVWSLVPGLMAGGRPAISLFEVIPGIEVAFAIEPLGMLFAALASPRPILSLGQGCWVGVRAPLAVEHRIYNI